MQRKFLVAIAAILVATAASAADLPLRQGIPAYTPPPPPPPPMWTNIYIGANIGGGWSATGVNPNNFAPYTDPVAGGVFLMPGSTNGASNAGGVVGGGQAGVNWEFRQSIVVGAEVDFQGTSMSTGGNAAWAVYQSPVTPGGFLVPLAPSGNIGVALNWFGTVRGRVGFLFTPAFLLYGTAGFAWGNVQGQYTGLSNTRTGWTAGGGVEWLLASNWSVKGEYLFVDLDSGGATGYLGYNYGYHRHPQFNILRAGVNYRFNLGGPDSPPLVMAY